MKNYDIKVVPVYEEDGGVSWMAAFPSVKGIVGGGKTAEEAVKEATENLELYIQYAEAEGVELADEYEESEFSGKLSLRIPKALHESLTMKAKSEGVSLNSYIQYALAHFEGREEALEIIDMKMREYNQKILETYAYVINGGEGEYNEKYSYGY